jgi:hypothetical protein
MNFNVLLSKYIVHPLVKKEEIKKGFDLSNKLVLLRVLRYLDVSCLRLATSGNM